MIRFLHGLVLLREIDTIAGARHTALQLQRLYPHKIVVIRRTSYIYRDVLCEVSQRNVTSLDDYVLMRDFAEYVKINKCLIRERVIFMEETNSKLFDYITVCGITFLKLDAEFKYMLQHYQPFLASFRDTKNVVFCKLMGDMKIGFY